MIIEYYTINLIDSQPCQISMVSRSDFINAFLNVMTKHLHFNCGKISVDILNALSFCFWFDGNYLPFGKIPASLASLSQCYEHNRNLFQLNILRKR